MTRCLAGVMAGMMAVGAMWVGLPEMHPVPAQEERSVAIQIKLEPAWPGWEGITLVSSTNEYCGESSARTEEGKLRMAISGVIQRITEKKSLISYDLEFRLTDEAGTIRLSAAGSGLFGYGTPTEILTMAGRRVILTAKPAEQTAGGQGFMSAAPVAGLAEKSRKRLTADE